MARITIEDCVVHVPNRFHLVQMAAIRAKQLKRGAQALVAGDQNKEVVVALREIAAGLVSPDEDAPIEPGTPEYFAAEAAAKAATEAPAVEPAAEASEEPTTPVEG